jgi:hypothetical protein
MKSANLKFINLCNHGLVDYSLVVIMWLSPDKFNLQASRGIVYIFSFMYLLLLVFTNYPLGFFPKISFSIHRILELISGIGFIILPFFADFYSIFADTVYCLILGSVFILLGLLTYTNGNGNISNPPAEK